MQPLQLLTDVPPLPANFASRAGLGPAMLASLESCLASSGLCVVHGAGGMGKTVATCATLRSEEALSELFPAGAAYVTIGQAPDVLSLQAQLLRAFGVQEPPADVSDGYARLLGALAGRRSLVVLDDIWNWAHLECFAPLRSRPKTWNGVAVLVTTRFADLVPQHSLGAELLRLGELTNAEAKQLLGIEEDKGDTLLAKLAKLCDRSPLALSILGATGKLEAEQNSGSGKSCWSTFCEELSQKTEPNAVKRCIGLASKRLSEEERELYLGMAVFPDDVLLPVEALRTIFRGRNLDVLLPRLASLHLVRLEHDGSPSASAAENGQRVSLHDLSLEFVKEQVARDFPGGEKQLHKDLIASYSSCLKGGGEWWTGPDDGYYFQRLLHHLAAADRLQDAQAMLLRWEWLAARLRRAGDAVALVADIREFAPPGALRPQMQGKETGTSKTRVAGSAAMAAAALGASPQAKARGSLPPRGKAAASPSSVLAKAKARGSVASPAAPAADAAASKAEPAVGPWGALLEVLMLSAHVLAEDARQLSFQVLGRLLGLQAGEESGSAGESESGSISKLCDGALTALKAGQFPLGHLQAWRVSVRPVSAGSLQGVGGPLHRTLQLHKDWVRSVAVSGDGSLLVSASNDLTVKVWDLKKDCRLLFDLVAHNTAVYTVDVCGDEFVISGDKDEAIMWSVKEGSLLRRWPGFEGELSVVHFVAPTLVAVAAACAVQVIPSSASSTSQKLAVCTHEARVASISTSEVPGGSPGEFLLACGCDDHHAVLWRLSPAGGGKRAKAKAGSPSPGAGAFQARQLTRFHVGEQDVRAIKLSLGGKLLACGNDDGVLRIWEATNDTKSSDPGFRQRSSAPGMHSDWIHSVSVATDGSLVACGSDDNSISLFDVSKSAVAGQVRIFSGAFSVALSPDKAWLFSASGDIRVWSVPKILSAHQAGLAGPAKHSEQVAALGISADGCVAVSVCPVRDADGKSVGLELGVWDCASTTQRCLCKVLGSAEDDDRPLCVCVSPDGTLAAVGCDTGKLWVLQLSNKETLWVEAEAHEERIHCCEWLGGDTIATGSEDGSVCCWSLKKRTCVARAQPYEAGVRRFAFTSDRRRVLCGGDYQAPRLAEMGGTGEDGRVLTQFKDTVRQELAVSTACSVSISSDDCCAVTCSWDKALRFWELETGQLLLAVTQVSDWVVKGFGATLAGDGAGLCVSYAWDRQLQLWDLSAWLGSRAERGEPRVVLSEDSDERLCTCQCDASLVHMACAPRWSDGVRRSLVFSDEDGGVHFFEAELSRAEQG